MASKWMYHEWLSKSHFSFLQSTMSPMQLVQASEALGYQSLCLNDFDGAYGLARFYNEKQALLKKQSVQLKLNYGAEIHLFADHDLPLLQQKTLVLNAFNWNGYKNLCQILSLCHKDSKDRAFLSLPSLLQQDLSDLFAIVPMRGGLDYFYSTSNDLSQLKEALNSELYLAVSRSFHRQTDRKINQVYDLAETLELGTLFSQDIFMGHRSDKAFHDVLLSIKNNGTLEESISYFLPNGEWSLHSGEQLQQMFRGLPKEQQSYRLMAELDERCEFCLSQLSYQYPKEFIPSGYTAQSYLEKVTWEGARQRFGENLSEPVVKTISRELDIIEDLGFADYFLTVWDIVSWARSQDILCQGRGSAANSSVCYVLGVTSCDPSLFDLLFERFVSKERGDPPDIDVDFEHERREEVIQYIYRRYGRAKAAMVANVITFKSKGVLRAVGKVFGVPETTLKTASKIISTVSFRRQGLAPVLGELKSQIGDEGVPKGFSWHFWLHFAERLKDFPRHLGLHSGGFVISQHNIDHLVPQEPATMEGRSVIQWCKDDIEELGFFKIDCLALGMLTAVRKCLQMLKDNYGVSYDLYNIPHEDPATYTMIQKADTVGVFQIESRAQMSMLPRLKPKTFYDLVIEIAIIRPGPIQGKVIHPFLKRRNGTEPVVYPSPEIKPILSKTLGVILFQEQLMRIAIALGDFTPGEANELRKHIGAWNSKAFDRNLNPYIEKLMAGLRRKNINNDFIEQMVAQMRGFAHYGFPESHAISFAFIAYASCYLKCHYPAAFFTSVLNSQPMGFYSPHALLQAARRQGVKVLPLTVNDSTWDHQLEMVPVKQGRPKQFAIRLGFRLVKSLSQQAVEAFVKEREEQGAYQDFNSFVQRTEIYRDDYSALAAANAFQCFGLNRFDALWKAEAVPFRSLIDEEERSLPWREKGSLQKSQLDFQSTGTTLETHPVVVLRDKHWGYKLKRNQLSSAQSLAEKANNRVVSVFGMILVKQAPPSAKGMVFLTLEDETGFINLAFTPQIYQKFFREVEGRGFLCISGRLQKVENYHSILVSQVHPMEKSPVVTINRANDVSHQTEGPALPYSPRSYF